MYASQYNAVLLGHVHCKELQSKQYLYMNKSRFKRSSGSRYQVYTTYSSYDWQHGNYEIVPH